MPRWDIDKAITDLEGSETPGTQLIREYLDIALFAQHKIEPTPRQVEHHGGYVWCLKLGHYHDRKLFVYAARIRECYLRARQQIKAMPEEQRKYLGVKAPPKSNSYAVARRQKKDKKKRTS